MSKGFAIDRALQMGMVVIAVVIIGTIAVSGALGDKVREGGKKTEEASRNIEGRVVISQPNQMAAAARFVMDRSRNCKKVENAREGVDGSGGRESLYLPLESTTLTARPECGMFGGLAGAPFSGGVLGHGTTGSGGDFEGKYSRVYFTVNEAFTLTTGKTPTENEDILDGLNKDSMQDAMADYTSGYTMDTTGGGDDYLWSGFNAGDGVPRVFRIMIVSKKPYSEIRAKKSKCNKRRRNWPYEYTLTFGGQITSSGASERITKNGQGGTLEDIRDYAQRNWDRGLAAGVYCRKDTGDDGKNAYWLARDKNQGKGHSQVNDGVRVQLCPGDKGYIQSNKKFPDNSGEASNDATPGGSDRYQYNYIQITELGECSS